MATITKRLTDDGTVSYQARVRLKGSSQQTATFARRTDAKRWALSTEVAIKEGKHFHTSEAKRRTLADAITRYERTHLATLKSVDVRRMQLAWWKGQAGALSLAAITPAVITESRDLLANEKVRQGKTRGPATINRYFTALSHVLTLVLLMLNIKVHDRGKR